MAQLDEARTVADTPAAHVSDHNTLHRQSNYVFDVKSYGAAGDGTTDDTTTIQAAIDAAETAGGGTTYMPSGEFRITATLTIPANVTITGSAPGSDSAAGGTRIRPETENQAVFTIGAGVRSVCVENLAIVGDGVATGMVGVLIQGAAPADADVQSLQFRNLRLYRLDKGIYINSTSGHWSVAPVSIQDCSMQEMTTAAIHVNSQNADGIHISSCMLTSATCVYLENSGFVSIDGTFGSGLDGADDVFVRIESNGAGPLVLSSCQAEQIDHFIKVGTGVGNYLAPTTLINCSVDAPITVNDNRKLVLIGCTLNADVDANDTDVLIFALGNTLSGSYAYNLTGSSRLVEIDDASASFGSASIGFYTATPVAQQTGVAVTAAGIHAALVNLGLITA